MGKNQALIGAHSLENWVCIGLSLCSCSAEEEAAPDGAVAEYRREKQKYEALRKQQPKKGTSREDQVTSELKSVCSSVLVSVPFQSCSDMIVCPGKHWRGKCTGQKAVTLATHGDPSFKVLPRYLCEKALKLWNFSWPAHVKCKNFLKPYICRNAASSASCGTWSSHGCARTAWGGLPAQCVTCWTWSSVLPNITAFDLQIDFHSFSCLLQEIFSMVLKQWCDKVSSWEELEEAGQLAGWYVTLDKANHSFCCPSWWKGVRLELEWPPCLRTLGLL